MKERAQERGTGYEYVKYRRRGGDKYEELAEKKGDEGIKSWLRRGGRGRGYEEQAEQRG